ncbi:MAG: hypothetical protein L3J71_13845 [Victivallaceae bacterium]|nr:hypothetical protein [Victivallaceae bacterium]
MKFLMKFIAVVAFIVIGFLAIKLLWAWTVPDLFPGAVEQNLVAAHISWFTAIKLSVFMGFLYSFSGIRPGKKDD